MEDGLLYIAQAAAGACYALFLERGIKRAYEPNLTWLTVVGGVAIVGLLVAARLALAPVSGTSASAGAWHSWWLVFWSFCASGAPVIGWQLAVDRHRIRELTEYVLRRGRSR